MAAIADGQAVMMAAPEGWTVDLDNPTRDEATIQAIWYTLGFGNAIALIFLGQNLYVKWWLQRQLQIETILLVLSWGLGLFVMAWLTDAISFNTTGCHMWEVTLPHFTRCMFIYYVCSTVYTFQIGMVKVALACFYRRISPALWWRWTIDILIGFIVCLTIVVVFLSIFTCNPIAKSWDVTIVDGTCLNRNVIYLLITCSHVALDLVLIVLPLPVILRLQMGTRQKAGLVLIFIIGGSTLVSSVMRLSILVPMLSNPDQTWAMAQAVLWIIIECTLLVICASLPTIRRFISTVAPKLMSEADPTTGATSGRAYQSEGFRTFGKGTDHRRKDQFGMTIDDEGKYEEDYNVKSLELRELGCGEQAKVTISALPQKHSSIPASNNKRRNLEVVRDAESESSIDHEGSGNNSTWDPLPPSGEEERAIIQTRTYTVRKE